MTDAPGRDRLAAVALRSLDLMAISGDGLARHAAAVLKGARSNGRPLIDDSEALAQVAAGESLTTVAMRMAGGDRKTAASIRRRLARKFGQ